MRTPAQVLAEMLLLTPSGDALPRSADSNWALFLGPIGSAWSDIEASAEAMLPEVDPRSAPYLLPDFERVLGPDPYGRDAPSQELTTAGRAALVYQRWTEGGGCSVADYEALAALAGQTITITEFWPAMCGEAECGVDLVADIPVVCGLGQCGDSIGSQGAQFYWQVGLAALNVAYAACGQAESGDLLGSYTQNLLGAVLQGEAPSHTQPFFTYS